MKRFVPIINDWGIYCSRKLLGACVLLVVATMKGKLMINFKRIDLYN